MRTLTLHTADALITRWKARAHALDLEAGKRPADDRIERMLAGEARAQAQALRVCAAELAAICAASMELEAAHHGDSEPVDFETALLEWSQGQWP
jgi:hypothetical protein